MSISFVVIASNQKKLQHGIRSVDTAVVGETGHFMHLSVSQGWPLGGCHIKVRHVGFLQCWNR